MSASRNATSWDSHCIGSNIKYSLHKRSHLTRGQDRGHGSYNYIYIIYFVREQSRLKINIPCMRMSTNGTIFLK